MAKKNITAQELLKRSKLSGRVNEEYNKIVNGLIACADCGAQATSIDTHISVADAIRRRLISNGFSVSNGEIRKEEIVRFAVGWTQKDCDEKTKAISDNLAKIEAYYRDKMPDAKHRTDQCCKSVNGKSAEQIDDPKPQPRKRPPSSTAPAVNQTGVTVIKNGTVNNAQQQKRGKKRHHNNARGGNMFNRSVIFEKCTFNIDVNITSNVDDINLKK